MEKESVVAPVQIILDVKAAARKLVQGEIQVHPGYADLQNRHGLVQMFDGDHEKAARSFREALAINPGYFWAASNLGFALVEMGQPDEALTLFGPESIFSVEDDYGVCRAALLLRADRLEEALRELDGEDSAEGYRDHLLGLCHLRLGDRESARRAFLEAAGTCPLLDRLYRQQEFLGPSALEKVSPRDAAETIPLHPGMHALMEFFAEIYARHGFRSRAVESYNDAQLYWPHRARHAWNVGRLASWLGESTEARRHFHEAIKLDPEAVDSHIALGLEYAAAGKVDEAETAFERAVELRPGFADVRYHLGLTYMEGGRFADAIESFRAALSINPSFHFARMNLAQAYRYEGDMEAAIREYEALLASGRATADLYLNLGLAFLEHGDPVRAEDCFREGISINPDFSLNHYYLGVACQRQGKRHNSRLAWKQFLERHRESELAEDARRMLDE